MFAAGAFAALSIAAFPDKPYIPLVLVLSVLLLAVAIARPMLVATAAVLAIPLQGLFQGFLLGPPLVLITMAVVGWLTRWVVSTPRTLPRHPALAAFALLVVVNAAGLIFAPEPFSVVRQAVPWGILLLAAVFLAKEASEDDVRRILLAFAISGGIGGVLAIWDPGPAVNTDAFIGGGVGERATGGLGSPNVLGVLVGMTIPVQLLFMLRGTPVIRVVAAGCGALSLAGISLAVSRGSIIGLVAAFVLLLFWRPFRRWVAVIVPILVVVAVIGPNPVSVVVDEKFVDRLTEVTSGGSSNPRWPVWQATPQMIADHPIFGVGAFQFGHYAQQYDLPVGFSAPFSHAHNLLLMIAAELGLLGLGAFLGLIFFVGGALTRVVRFSTGFTEAMGWALIAAFSVQLAAGLVDYALGAQLIAVGTFVLVGCSIALDLRVRAARGSALHAREPVEASG